MRPKRQSRSTQETNNAKTYAAIVMTPSLAGI